MKVLVYERPDGGIDVETPAPGLNLADVRARVEKVYPERMFVGEFEHNDLPQREFREQWRKNGSAIRIDPTLETPERWRRIRARRDKRLLESDGPMLRANELDQQVIEWMEYRQALRDVTLQPDPKNITWPTKPS